MRGAQSGFGLVDTLMALVLLALSLLGACTLLVRSQAASRAATLQTAAVDLATDLVEELRARSGALPDVDMLDDWRGRVADALPVGTPPLPQFAQAAPQASDASQLEVSLRWWDPSLHLPTTLTLQAASNSSRPGP